MRGAAGVIRFFERPYPSANSVLLTGPNPVLVDTGFGADAPALLGWLAAEGVVLDRLRVLNTHAHSDHVGGNAALQRHGVPVAGLAPVVAGDRDACRAWWLQQPVEAYQVSHILQGGEVVDTGTAQWQVLATPGHTPDHVSLYADGVLVLGDALHAADLGWLDPRYPAALDWTEATLDRLAQLPARAGYSGHGPGITDVPAALGRARRRVQSWRADPARIAWHACKRIFAHALMLTDGVDAAGLERFAGAPWVRDHAALLGFEPEAFIPALLAEAVRADAVAWRDGRLRAVAVHAVPGAGWARGPVDPAQWIVSDTARAWV